MGAFIASYSHADLPRLTVCWGFLEDTAFFPRLLKRQLLFSWDTHLSLAKELLLLISFVATINFTDVTSELDLL